MSSGSASSWMSRRAFEIDAEAFELVLAVARAESKREPALAEDVNERRVLGNANRIGERQRDNRGADLDPFGQRRQIGRIHEHIRHDPVFIAEMMLRHPGVIVAELVGAQDFARHPRVHVAVRVGFAIGVGM